MRDIGIIGAAGLSILLTAAIVVAELGPPVELLPRHMALNGKFRSSAMLQDAAEEMPWSVEVQRDANGLLGRISVAGLQAFEYGSIDAVIAWPRVEGDVIDDAGSVVATFEGHLAVGGIAGTFATASGDLGLWSWRWPAEP